MSDASIRSKPVVDQPSKPCLCGAGRCRGSVTGWKDVPAARKADYGDHVAPYLLMMVDEIPRAIRHGSR